MLKQLCIIGKIKAHAMSCHPRQTGVYQAHNRCFFEEGSGGVARTIILDTRAMVPFEIGARLDALLCYSTWSIDRQKTIANAICTDLIAQWVQMEPCRSAELNEALPQYRRGRNRASLATLHKRRDEALKVGLAFLPVLKQPAIGELPMLCGERRPLPNAEIARFIWPAREDGNEENYENRLHDNLKLLRKMRPIAHLAAAYQFIARMRSGREQASSFDYQDLDFHREAVRRANFYADCFHSVAALTNIASKLVTVEWRE